MATTKKKSEYTGAEEIEVQEPKKAVNILDLLLGSDIGKISLPTKQLEITRLSDLFGSPFIITCRALSPEKYEEVQDMALTMKGKDVDVDVPLLQVFTVIEGVIDDAGKPLLKNKDLLSKFKAQTPKELVRILFLSGEISNIYSEIAQLSGFGEDAVKEVKN